ncbi:unnamed protein product [Ceratitis capitata]|uniref:(Mediterranean fruit fly) hypothetical protein n=2 Tax=Ceratitis capitata TaxID=7213 RepID=W8BAS7_CERCA|nr:unnamed protein product [Ceratitis capitata]
MFRIYYIILLLLAVDTNLSTSAPTIHGPDFKFDSQIEQAMFEFYVDLFSYLSFYETNTKSLFEKALQDKTIVQNKDLQQQKAILAAYIAKVNERLKPLPKNATTLDGFLSVVAKIHTVNLFEDIVQKFNTTALLEPSETDELIEDALKRNGLVELINELKMRKMEFLNDFLRKMDTYVATLTEEDRRKSHRIVDWYHKYQRESDDERANDVFTHFTRLFARF